MEISQKLGKNQSFQEWRFQTWETGMRQNTKTPTKILLYKNSVKVPVDIPKVENKLLIGIQKKNKKLVSYAPWAALGGPRGVFKKDIWTAFQILEAHFYI